jgi:hypothetical protein
VPGGWDQNQLDLDERVSELRSVPYVTVRPSIRGQMSAQGLGDICNAVIDSDLLGQVLPNLCQQFARAVGFRDITVATGRMRFAVVAAQGIGSDGDNRNVF